MLSNDVEQVFLALGSNLNDRLSLLNQALERLDDIAAGPMVPSSVFETPALGPQPQEPYLNQCVGLSSGASPEALLSICQKIEREFGRCPGPRWGPRTLDIDILLFGNRLINTPDLTVPHPGLTERQFVLFPLSDIAPCIALPHTGHSPLFHLSTLILAKGMDKIRLVRRRSYRPYEIAR